MSDMSTTSPSRSPVRRLFQFLAFGVFTLIALLLGIVAYVNFRGQREWAQFRSEWEAKGERFDFVDFIPTAVPDDQNFADAECFMTIYIIAPSMNLIIK